MYVYQRCQWHRRKKRKFLAMHFFIFCLSPLYTCRLNFCLVFIFRSRQAGTVSSVLLSAVSLTRVNNFSAVSLTPAINVRLFGYFWPVSTIPGTQFYRWCHWRLWWQRSVLSAKMRTTWQEQGCLREKTAMSPAARVGQGYRWYHWNHLEKTHTTWFEAPEASKTTPNQ